MKRERTSTRFDSVRVVNAYTGESSHYFVPTVQWQCGHRGFTQDWMNPSCCPHCGCEEFASVDMSEPKKVA